jgi:outer membrane protein assembly factor BamB
MKRLSVILVSFLLYLPLCAQFKGTVSVDTNQSGIVDKGDKPLAGVMVTDGLNVVKTDKKGRFSLPGFEKTRFISITTPAGFETQQFYLSTKENRKSYDFILTESERTKPRKHSFVQITDTEVTGGMGRWVTDLQQYIDNEKPAFLIHTGDICYEPGLTIHNQVVNAQTMDCPVYYCIGNHDLVKGNYGEELYESLYGPTWYSFDIGNVHYVVTPIDHGDNPTNYTQRDVYNWLKNDLALIKKDQALILFNHDLFTPNDSFVFKADDDHLLDFRSFNTKAQIYGHMHYNYVRNQNGIYTICTGTLDKGGIDHSPSSFREIKVDANDNITTQLRYAFIEPQIAIVSPMNNQTAAACTITKDQLPVSVNTYYSQAKTSHVSYILSDSENNQEIAKGDLASRTEWNWSGNIQMPANEMGKKLNLTVTSFFSNGKKATATSQFIYQKDFKLSTIAGEDWNTLLQNAAHSGGVNNSQIKLPLQLQWTANTGSNIFMCSPIIAGQKVFIATTDDNVSLNTFICAFNFNSGKLLWKFRTANSVKNTIAYENGIVVAQDASCNLYALDSESGKLLWKQSINLDSYPYLTEGLTVDKGVVYAGIGAGLSAYNLKTGQTIWTNKDWKQREGSTTTLTIAGDVLVSGTNGEVYTAMISTQESNSGNYLTTDLATGEPLLSIKTGNYGLSLPRASSQ